MESVSSNVSERMARSVLGQLLPEAMVAYLDNHGPEKFATIFSGSTTRPRRSGAAR